MGDTDQYTRCFKCEGAALVVCENLTPEEKVALGLKGVYPPRDIDDGTVVDY